MKRLTLMLTLALSGLLFAGAFEQADAHGRHHVYIRIGPPAARIVVRPASPWRDGIWIDGYWGWEHGRHVWIDGRWARPVRGHFWVDGRWVHTATAGNGTPATGARVTGAITTTGVTAIGTATETGIATGTMTGIVTMTGAGTTAAAEATTAVTKTAAGNPKPGVRA
ncbi:MAG TPA: YXWGXW repeat-containing protein [bacterium]|nr:YXWGXW repeat-containing protein [bacterium]